MRWPDLLAGLEAELILDLPDFLVKAGTWLAAPNVDAVHLQVAKETAQGYGFAGYTLYIDLFVRVAAGEPHLVGYRKLDEYQQVIEQRLKEFSRVTPGVTSIFGLSWEQDGGAFVPTFASRLTALATCITDSNFCGGCAPLVI
jgi:hypothetical protein